jgi:hypothetical protein
VSHSSLVEQAGVDPYVNSQALLGSVHFCRGFPDRALARSNAAIAEAQKFGLGARARWLQDHALVDLLGDAANEDFADGAAKQEMDRNDACGTAQMMPSYSPPPISSATRTLTLSAFPGRYASGMSPSHRSGRSALGMARKSL